MIEGLVELRGSLPAINNSEGDERGREAVERSIEVPAKFKVENRGREVVEGRVEGAEEGEVSQRGREVVNGEVEACANL